MQFVRLPTLRLARKVISGTKLTSVKYIELQKSGACLDSAVLGVLQWGSPMTTVENLLLAAMPQAIAEELMASGGDFSVAAGDMLPKEQLDGTQVFIVTRGIASKFQISPNGRSSEVGMVGREGLFPAAALLDVPSSPHIVLVQIGPLEGRRVRTKNFLRIVRDSPEALELVHRYVYAFLVQISSNLLCTEQTVMSRLARWLLMCHDRLPGDTIEVTHEALAQMTVSHRPTISNALQAMRAQGMIDTGRACITVRDRNALRHAADGGYGAFESYAQERLYAFGKAPSLELEGAGSHRVVV